MILDGIKATGDVRRHVSSLISMNAAANAMARGPDYAALPGGVVDSIKQRDESIFARITARLVA